MYASMKKFVDLYWLRQIVH